MSVPRRTKGVYFDEDDSSTGNVGQIEVYEGNYKTGFALIINNETFTDERLSDMPGSKDEAMLFSNVLKNLGFNVELHHNLNVGEMIKAVNSCIENIPTDCWCFICVVLSHGTREGRIYATDDHLGIQESLIKPFRETPKLHGIPKIFIIEACRGNTLDEAVSVARSGPRFPQSTTIPRSADVLECYPCADGSSAWFGNFLQTFETVLQKYVIHRDPREREYHVLELLTMVNNEVSKKKVTVTAERTTIDAKQMPAPITTLTKLLYFKPRVLHQNKKFGYKDCSLLCIGGDSTRSDVIKFDTTQTTWEHTSIRLQKARDGCCAGVIGGTVYVCGGDTTGETTEGVPTASVESFALDTTPEPELNQSYVQDHCPPMSTKRCMAAVVVYNESLIISGGFDENHITLATVESYSPLSQSTNHTWRLLPSLNHRRYGHSMVACQGCLYVIGGHDGVRPIYTVERLSLVSFMWERVADMSSRRAFLTAAVLDDSIFAICGTADDDISLNTVECYDVTNDAWSDVSDTRMQRSCCSSAVMHGNIYLLGGETTSKRLTVEVYCSKTNEWNILCKTKKFNIKRSALVAI